MTHALVFCCDCRHFQGTKKSVIDGSKITVNWCLTKPTYNLVTGQEMYRLAETERTIVNEPDTHCSKEGFWFEPITEVADLDDLSTIPFGK